jgi:hypothetical protein
MNNGREVPFDLNWLLAMTPPQRPENDMQALMEAAPRRRNSRVKRITADNKRSSS